MNERVGIPDIDGKGVIIEVVVKIGLIANGIFIDEEFYLNYRFFEGLDEKFYKP